MVIQDLLNRYLSWNLNDLAIIGYYSLILMLLFPISQTYLLEFIYIT